MNDYHVNAITNTTYTNCNTINSINLRNVPWVNNSIVSAFRNCTNLTQVTNINNNVTNMQSTFQNCIKLITIPTIPNGVTDIRDTFSYCTNLVNAPIIPNSVIEMASAFSGCTNLTNIPEIPDSITNMSYTFSSCKKLTGDIYIRSNKITNAESCFFSTTLQKNIYIPFGDGNGAYSATYNAFINAGYDEIGTQEGVILLASDKKTLTINTDPIDATVEFIVDNQITTSHSITVLPGTTVNYTISKDLFNTKTGTLVVNEDTILDISIWSTLTYDDEKYNIETILATDGKEYTVLRELIGTAATAETVDLSEITIIPD